MEYNFTYRDKDKGLQVILSYKDHLGNWRQKSKQGFKTRREAKIAGDKLLDIVKESMAFSADATMQDITFKEFSDLFLKEQAKVLEYKTIVSYRSAIKVFSALHKKPIADIAHADILQIINSLDTQSSSINLMISKIKRIFNYAVKPYRIIKESPLIEVKLLPLKKDKKPKALNQDDLRHLLGELEKNSKLEYFMIASIAAYAGLRIGEILGLTYPDISFKNCEIIVNKQWGATGPKAYDFKVLKSTNSTRIVPIPAALVTTLSQYYKNTSVKNISGRLFAGIDHSISLNNELKKINPSTSIHSLRHTYATFLISRQIDVQTIAALIGDTTDVVITTYLHYTDDLRKKAKNDIAKIF